MPDEAERKLVAILAADMVGFSRQLGLDEAGTLTRLERARNQVIDPAIATHRGRIFKVMGDGILAEFPSAVLALRAAVAIQAMLAERGGAASDDAAVVLRIGIHQGEVVVAGDDLLGDGVNIAARIEPLAPPGGICVSARVHEDSLGKLPLAFHDLGERTLKNILRPVRVLHVLPDVLPAGATPPAEGTLIRRSAAADDAERTILRTRVELRHWLTVSGPGGAPRRLGIAGEPLEIGRQPPCALVLNDPEVSRRHCRIVVVDGQAELTDLNSTNGTFLDGGRIAAPTRLAPGARVTLGSHVLVYERERGPADPDATGTLHRPTAPPGFAG